MGLVLVVYEPLVVAQFGCTLGKLMFGIRVRQAADPAKNPWLSQALGRWAMPVVSGGALLWFVWEAWARLLSEDFGGRDGDIFSFLDGGHENPFAEDLFAWMLLNSMFFGVVVGLPLMSGVLCVVGARSDGRGWHDWLAGTIVVRADSVADAAPEPVQARWKRFSQELEAGYAEQYERDATACKPESDKNMGIASVPTDEGD